MKKEKGKKMRILIFLVLISFTLVIAISSKAFHLKDSSKKPTQTGEDSALNDEALNEEIKKLLDNHYKDAKEIKENVLVKLNEKINDFNYTSTDGNTYNIKDTAKNGGVIIEAMGTWCGACHSLVPTIDSLKNSSFIPIISLAIDDDLEDIKAFEKENNTSGYHKADSHIIYDLGLVYTPSLYFLNEDLEIKAIMTGGITEESVLDFIETIY